MPETPSLPPSTPASVGRPRGSKLPYSKQSPNTRAKTLEDFIEVCQHFATKHSKGELAALFHEAAAQVAPAPTVESTPSNIENLMQNLQKLYHDEPVSTKKPVFSALAASLGLTRPEVEKLGFSINKQGKLSIC
jgi:hypothetical protein